MQSSSSSSIKGPPSLIPTEFTFKSYSRLARLPSAAVKSEIQKLTEGRTRKLEYTDHLLRVAGYVALIAGSILPFYYSSVWVVVGTLGGYLAIELVRGIVENAAASQRQRKLGYQIAKATLAQPHDSIKLPVGLHQLPPEGYFWLRSDLLKARERSKDSSVKDSFYSNEYSPGGSAKAPWLREASGIASSKRSVTDLELTVPLTLYASANYADISTLDKKEWDKTRAVVHEAKESVRAQERSFLNAAENYSQQIATFAQRLKMSPKALRERLDALDKRELTQLKNKYAEARAKKELAHLERKKSIDSETPEQVQQKKTTLSEELALYKHEQSLAEEIAAFKDHDPTGDKRGIQNLRARSFKRRHRVTLCEIEYAHHIEEQASRLNISPEELRKELDNLDQIALFTPDRLREEVLRFVEKETSQTEGEAKKELSGADKEAKKILEGKRANTLSIRHQQALLDLKLNAALKKISKENLDKSSEFIKPLLSKGARRPVAQELQVKRLKTRRATLYAQFEKQRTLLKQTYKEVLALYPQSDLEKTLIPASSKDLTTYISRYKTLLAEEGKIKKQYIENSAETSVASEAYNSSLLRLSLQIEELNKALLQQKENHLSQKLLRAGKLLAQAQHSLKQVNVKGAIEIKDDKGLVTKERIANSTTVKHIESLQKSCQALKIAHNSYPKHNLIYLKELDSWLFTSRESAGFKRYVNPLLHTLNFQEEENCLDFFQEWWASKPLKQGSSYNQVELEAHAEKLENWIKSDFLPLLKSKENKQLLSTLQKWRNSKPISYYIKEMDEWVERYIAPLLVSLDLKEKDKYLSLLQKWRIASPESKDTLAPLWLEIAELLIEKIKLEARVKNAPLRERSDALENEYSALQKRVQEALKSAAPPEEYRVTANALEVWISKNLVPFKADCQRERTLSLGRVFWEVLTENIPQGAVALFTKREPPRFTPLPGDVRGTHFETLQKQQRQIDRKLSLVDHHALLTRKAAPIFGRALIAISFSALAIIFLNNPPILMALFTTCALMEIPLGLLERWSWRFDPQKEQLKIERGLLYSGPQKQALPAHRPAMARVQNLQRKRGPGDLEGTGKRMSSLLVEGESSFEKKQRVLQKRQREERQKLAQQALKIS